MCNIYFSVFSLERTLRYSLYFLIDNTDLIGTRHGSLGSQCLSSRTNVINIRWLTFFFSFIKACRMQLTFKYIYLLYMCLYVYIYLFIISNFLATYVYVYHFTLNAHVYRVLFSFKMY